MKQSERTIPLPIFYSARDAAAALSIGRTSLYQLVKDRKLRTFKIGGRTVIARTELERFAATIMQDAA